MDNEYTTALPGADELASSGPTEAVQAPADAKALFLAQHTSDCSSTPAAASQRMPEKALFAPGRGTFFDEHIDLQEPEGTRLTECIIEYYDEVRPRKRKRGRDTLALRVRKIVANAMRVHFFRDPPAVLYFRKADTEWYEDKPNWMKHGALGEAVNALADAGLVRKIKGKRMPWQSTRKSWASSYWATDKLVRMALECGVSKESIDRLIPADALVQLYAPKPGAQFKLHKGGLVHARKGKRIWFEPTAETQEWVATLEAINAFYRQQEIALGLSPAELKAWLVKRNADPNRKGVPYRLPEMFSSDVYRVFNEGNETDPKFDKGGRLFGGWWMSIPGELRNAITINGQPTAELDYKNCHPRMLYAIRGLDCEGDLYALPEIAAVEEAEGLAVDTYRPYVKWLMQVLINGKGRPQAADVPDHITMPRGLTVNEVVGFIEAKHKPIAEDFKTGAGLGLMRIESEISLEIVATAMAEGWPVLSVHDSYITTTDQRDRLKTMMISTYAQRLGKEPAIKE